MSLKLVIFKNDFFMKFKKAFLILSNMIDAQFGSVPGYFQDTLELRKRSPCDFAGQF